MHETTLSKAQIKRAHESEPGSGVTKLMNINQAMEHLLSIMVREIRGDSRLGLEIRSGFIGVREVKP